MQEQCKSLEGRVFTPPGFASPGENEVVVSGCSPTNHEECGLHGSRYGIPASAETIASAVTDFINLAYEWDQTTFWVTREGFLEHGLADAVVAPLFAPCFGFYNVRLPEEYARLICV